MRSLSHYKKIDRSDLDSVVRDVVSLLHLNDTLIHTLGTVRGSNGTGTTFIHPLNPLFTSLWVHEEDGRPCGLGLSGIFDLGFHDFINLYGEPRQAYVPYDGAYHYFFNENSKEFSIWIVGEAEPIAPDRVVHQFSVKLLGIC